MLSTNHIKRIVVSKIRFVNFIECLCFFLAFTFRSFANTFYNSKDIPNPVINMLKYLFMGVGIFLAILELYWRNKNKKNKFEFLSETKNILFVLCTFLIISLFEILITRSFTMLTIDGLLYIFLGIIYAFLFINTTKPVELYWTLAMVLVSSFVLYAIEVGFENFSFDVFFQSSFVDSKSSLESSYSAGVALALCSYFCINRKNMFVTIVSLVFCIITFKRILILSGIILFFVPLIIKKQKKPSKFIVNFTILFFIIATILYTILILKPGIISYDDMVKFTVGRSDILNNLIINKYQPFGYSSSTAFLRNIEMDLVRILIEMTPIGLIIFVVCYFNIAKSNWYSFIFMVCIFLNLLFSHSLGTCFTWAIYFITIYSANTLEKKKEGM